MCGDCVHSICVCVMGCIGVNVSCVLVFGVLCVCVGCRCPGIVGVDGVVGGVVGLAGGSAVVGCEVVVFADVGVSGRLVVVGDGRVVGWFGALVVSIWVVVGVAGRLLSVCVLSLHRLSSCPFLIASAILMGIGDD